MKINTTPETINEIKSVIAANPEEGEFVRLYVAGFGCSGPQFGLALDGRNDDDIYYEEGGQGFVMQQNVYEQWGDFIVEFSEGGYLVQPENMPTSAGCAGCSGC